MGLTYPIDTVDPREIPAFNRVFEVHKIDADRLAKMVKYVCFRYDPKSDLVKEESSEKKKKDTAERLSGYTCPKVDKSMVNEEGEFVPSTEVSTLMAVTTAFFALLNNPRWESICTMLEVISEGHEMMRVPIHPDMDLDSQLKLGEYKGKLAERNMKLLDQVEVQIDRMADGDLIAKIAINTETSKAAYRDPVSGKMTD